ncbi:hypothetical protein BGZ96_002947, partial [Linnemannia gamsii]
LSLGIPATLSDPTTFAPNVTLDSNASNSTAPNVTVDSNLNDRIVPNVTIDFGVSDRIAPLQSNAQQSYYALKTTKRFTSVRANVGVSRTIDAGGSSLGVCYYGEEGDYSGCAEVSTDSTGCLVSGRTSTATKRLPKGYVNRHVEIHANKDALCLDYVGFSYGTGDMHPGNAKITVTGDMTFECGHPWAYSGQDTNGFQHKCLFIGNVENQGYTNTYTFKVEELLLATEALRQTESNNLESVPNTVRYSCNYMSSWSRNDLPKTNSDCGQYDNIFEKGQDGPKKMKYISEEVHLANLRVNPHYAGSPVVNGTVEIDTNYV